MVKLSQKKANGKSKIIGDFFAEERYTGQLMERVLVTHKFLLVVSLGLLYYYWIGKVVLTTLGLLKVWSVYSLLW